MVIHRTPGAHTPPKFVLNFRWFLDVILPGGMSRCCLQTWDLNRRPEPYFIWDTCSLRTWRKWRIFGQQKFESENPHQIRLVTSHILPILTTPLTPKESAPPLLLNSFGMISFKPWLAHPALVGEPQWQRGVPGDCIFVGSHDDSCMWSGLGTKGFVRIFPWGQHWQPKMDCHWSPERFTNGLFLFISEYFRGYQFV